MKKKRGKMQRYIFIALYKFSVNIDNSYQVRFRGVMSKKGTGSLPPYWISFIYLYSSVIEKNQMEHWWIQKYYWQNLSIICFHKENFQFLLPELYFLFFFPKMVYLYLSPVHFSTSYYEEDGLQRLWSSILWKGH